MASLRAAIPDGSALHPKAGDAAHLMAFLLSQSLEQAQALGQ